MSDRHVVVYIAADPHQAHLLRNLLDEEGIKAFVSNETLNAVHFAGADWLIRAAGAPGFLPTSPKVLVHESDAERARQVLLEAEELILHSRPAPELLALEAESGLEQAWPLCPHCARPRLTTCPICKTSGTDFHPAFMPEGESPDDGDPARLVICPTCDEVFAPRHPARCEWCGHRFADGPQASAPPASGNLVTPVWITLAEQLSPRAVVLLAILAGATVALVGWFAYVLR